MSKNPSDLKDESSDSLDLNTLSSIDFGPSWADKNPDHASKKRYDNYGDGKNSKKGKHRSSGPNSNSRDRRPKNFNKDGAGAQSGSARNNERFSNSSGRRSGEHGRGSRFREAPFEPTVKIDIYPQDEAFDALVKRLQATSRTYQLFELAKLLLEKQERFMVVVAPKASSDSEANKKKLYFSVPGHLPFETEDDAVNYVLSNHLDSFFEVEAIEVEAPKGNFLMVNRCSITGELLGPPNYHRYQDFIQRHYSSRINGMSFERFQSKIEAVKDQEVIDEWVTSMKQGARYTVKEPKEGEPKVLETLEAAKLFLLQYRKQAVVGSGESVRFAGRDLERLNKGDILKSVESYIESQRHFPLETANNIRGRLRRHNFTIYKKGSKGVSFVCAVKRKFRDSQSTFTETIQKLIDFIEANPQIKASSLPLKYLGIEASTSKPSELKLSEGETEGVAVDSEAKEEPQVEVAETKEVAETEEVIVEAKTELSENDKILTKQLSLDLRWLISEGYVTEYGDGSLFAAAILPDPKPKAPLQKQTQEPEASEVASVPEAVEKSVPTSEVPDTVKAQDEIVEAKASVDSALETEAEVETEAEAEVEVEKEAEETDLNS